MIISRRLSTRTGMGILSSRIFYRFQNVMLTRQHNAHAPHHFKLPWDLTSPRPANTRRRPSLYTYTSQPAVSNRWTTFYSFVICPRPQCRGISLQLSTHRSRFLTRSGNLSTHASITPLAMCRPSTGYARGTISGGGLINGRIGSPSYTDFNTGATESGSGAKVSLR